jgi:DNA (cytosine-5)-methyltransferase 1
VSDLIIDGFAGPGGWDVAAARLGLSPVVGIELDATACATRAAAGHLTIRADISRYPAEALSGRVRGSVFSPVCTTFSAAGTRAGVAVLAVLDASVRDALHGRKTRAARRREMAAELRRAWWPSPKLTSAGRSAAIWKAVRSASLAAEPARFIHACRPEWVAMEQVPAVLPLWQAYAEELRRLGYSAWCGKLNAADYGVPQTRIRAILIASRAHQVGRPVPTHYDPRKGMQLFGSPWVSMAEALGWGATIRPVPTVTAGGVALGGYEPFAKGGREALGREQEAGRWALRIDGQRNGTCRPGHAPADTIKAGHSSADMRWVRTNSGNGDAHDYQRDMAEPSSAVVPRVNRWVLHTNRDQRPDGTRQTADPQTAPAPALTAKSGGQWVLRTSFGEPSDRGGTHEMNPAIRPAHAVTTKAKDWVAWVRERPATTVQGDPRVGRPGHKDRDKGESQFAQDSVRITVGEAAALQSFPPGYPWQGTRTAQFRQVGDAMPPGLAEPVLAMAAGIARAEAGAA